MYSKLFSKAGAAVMSAALALNGVAVSTAANFTTVAADTIKVEFEDAELTGATEVAAVSAASGGSVAYMQDDGTISLSFDAPSAGMYTITIYAAGVGGSKQQNISINGAAAETLAISKGSDTEFNPVTINAKLNSGKNTVLITSSWGWTKFDYLTAEAAVLPEIKATQTTPVDASATAETRALMDYLSSIYGEHTLSGQQEIYQYGPHGLETEFEYLYDLTGHYPAIRGFDYGNFTCPAFGSDDGSTDRIIDWVKNRNGIATSSWHINVPKDMKSYSIGDRIDWAQTTYGVKSDDGSEATNFVTSNAYKEGTKEYEYYRQALTTLAAEFKKLEAEGIPIIWRPLHEAEGGGGENGSWFWWGKEGSEVYKKLWVYTYETLTNDFNCHNLIWEWNSYDFDTSADWYPGDSYVDIIGYDKYNCTVYLAEDNWAGRLVHNDSAISSTFYSIMQRYNSAKMVAMAENDCFSTVDNLTSEKAGWLYFLTWYDGGSDNINFLSNPIFNTEEDTIAMYQSDYCVTLDELPADLYNKDVPTIDPALTTTVATTTAVSTTATTAVTTEADPTKNYGTIKYNSKDNNYTIKLPEPSEDFFLQVEVPDGIGYANGGLGVTVELDGEYYWANIMWEASKSGDVAVNVVDNFLNCSLGTKTVEDEAIIEAVKAKLAAQDTYQGQIWYASDTTGEEADNSGVKLLGAYISTADPDVTTTTAATTADASKTLYGDANCDGKVNIGDAVAILQNLANSSKYPLTEQGQINADVDGEAGLTGNDAIAIQQVDAKVIKQSDLPLTK